MRYGRRCRKEIPHDWAVFPYGLRRGNMYINPHFIHQQPTTITEFDETLVKRLITKITVFEDHFTIDFKSGVTIDIEA